MRDMTATEVRLRAVVSSHNAALWSDALFETFKENLFTATGINDSRQGVVSMITRSYLTVCRGSGSSFREDELGILVWRRYARGYQIPRGLPTSSYVDLTLKVSPAQPEEEHKSVPRQVAKSRIRIPDKQEGSSYKFDEAMPD